MKALIRGLAVVVLSLLARDAFATDVAGKWGLGAGFGNNATDISLIHGRSARSAWLLDVEANLQAITLHESDTIILGTPVGGKASSIALDGGPGLRMFTNPNGDFSPYWDVFVHGRYIHMHDDTFGAIRQERYGAEVGMAIGAEYFTKWHCSIAAHTSLVSVNWDRVSQKQSTIFGDASQDGHIETFDFGVSPRLFVRAYF